MTDDPHAPTPDTASLAFTLDGAGVTVPDDGRSLLDVLRDDLGVRSAKDGCSPQGQCGCCTVLVDGQPRVACVTPARRVAGREVTTLDGLDVDRRDRWASALCAVGGSQCGFCTPGIVVRLEAHRARTGGLDRTTIDKALAAHLCRCTGWQTIVEAALDVSDAADGPAGEGLRGRDVDAAARRATLEGGAPQRVGPDVALGAGGFAADTAPDDALVAVPDGAGGWVVAESLSAARQAAGKVQGRRTTVRPAPPLDVPPGEWLRTLRTSWVDPAYLETDTSWCVPGGTPASPLSNGGAFGGKVDSPLPEMARRLADEHGRAVRVVWSREDTVRYGPKRPPIAAGVRADGTGVVRVARTPGIAERIAAVAPGFEVVEVDVAGPPTSAAIRGAGWVEAAVLLDACAAAADHVAADHVADVRSPEGARATARWRTDGVVEVHLWCGEILDAVVARSYAIGAAHLGISWVRSEGLAVGPDGEVGDLTVRSFGVLRAADTPHIEVVIEPDDGPAVPGSDAVLAAVAAATWRRDGFVSEWPTH